MESLPSLKPETDRTEETDARAKCTIGLIINPIAGMGGRVGLKGTDGPAAVSRARALGATPQAPTRARQALDGLGGKLRERLALLTAPGEMGERVVRAAELPFQVIGTVRADETTPADTEWAAAAMCERGVDLLVFVGGDGTARNIANAVGTGLPVLGVPAGVKMHSAVYATTPHAVAAILRRHLEGAPMRCREAEVMDIDEDAFRAGRVSAKLYGHLLVPQEPGLMQGLKSASAGGEDAALAGIAAEIVERMDTKTSYIIGPGTTTRAITDRLRLPKTLLGVDVVRGGKLIASDVNEAGLLALTGDSARIVVTPIGGQGYLFGRGNQQIGPRVIERADRKSIIVVATPGKLASLRGQPFLVDTGRADLDRALGGFVRVVTGYRTETVYRIAS